MDGSRMTDDATPSLHDELLQTVQDMVRQEKHFVSRMKNFGTVGAFVAAYSLDLIVLF